MAIFEVFAMLCGLLPLAFSVELTFELPDNEKMCFYEDVKNGTSCILEYQVISGGNYDVDVELFGPGNKQLYKDTRKQYDSYSWTAIPAGEYKFCFSNEFSSFTHKLIYFDVQIGDDDPLARDLGAPITAMTQMETSGYVIHENLKTIIDYQTHHRLRESMGRSFAEDLNATVQMWSIVELVIILVIGMGQVIVLRSFFTEKRPGRL